MQLADAAARMMGIGVRRTVFVMIGFKLGQLVFNGDEFGIAFECIVQRAGGERGRFLRDLGNHPVSGDVEFALVLMQLAAQQSKQARLAAAIGTDDAQAPSGMDLQGEILDQAARAASKRKFAKLDHFVGSWDNAGQPHILRGQERAKLRGMRYMQRKLMGLLILLTSSAWAQTSAPLAEDDPAVWTARAARAANLREESSHLRRAADAERTQADIACRKKILENACKNSARERWIEEINKVRALEIEAVGLERNQRAHEIAMREKARAAKPQRPPLVLPDASSSPAGSASKPGAAPKPQAKPRDPGKLSAQATKRQQASEEKAQEAAARATQARKDAERYAARAREHAAKEAQRNAKQSVPAGEPASAK